MDASPAYKPQIFFYIFVVNNICEFYIWQCYSKSNTLHSKSARLFTVPIFLSLWALEWELVKKKQPRNRSKSLKRKKGIQPKIVKIPLTSQMANQALISLKPISTQQRRAHWRGINLKGYQKSITHIQVTCHLHKVVPSQAWMF